MAAAVLAKLLLGSAVGGGLLYLLAGNSSAANTTGGSALSCTDALARIPAELRAPAQAALNAPQTAANRVAADALATSLDNSAKNTSVPADVREALRVVVTCLRNYAKIPPDTAAPGGGGGTLDLISCDAALDKLDPVMASTAKALLAGPKTADTAKQLRTLALTFESSAAIAPDAARGPLQTAAQCLRLQADAIDKGPSGGGPSSTAGVIYDPNGTPSSWDGGPPQAGKASNPKYQWRHEVLAGESAWVVTTHVFGSGASWTRVIELIQNNPKDYYGRPLGTVGDPKNPQSTGYNFASLKPGDVLALPKSWNAWIDQEGTDRNAPTPYPNP